MKVVSLVSSHRRHGNTSSIAALLEESLQEISAAEHTEIGIERVTLCDYGIKPCIGCRVCFDKGEGFCPNKDGLAEVAWGFYVAGMERYKMGALMNTSDIKANYKNKIDKAAKGLFTAIHLNKPAKPKFYSLIVFKVQQRFWQRSGDKPGKEDTVDYAYWKNNGWLAPGCEYYFPQKSNILKVKAARLIGSLVAIFFA